MAKKEEKKSIYKKDGSVNIEELTAKILLIVKSRTQFESIIEFLIRRGFPTYVATEMDEAVETLTSKQIDFVFISFNHPNQNLNKLPLIIERTFAATPVGFCETPDLRTESRLTAAKMQFKLVGTASGPSIHRKVKSLLTDMYMKAKPDKKQYYVDNYSKNKLDIVRLKTNDKDKEPLGVKTELVNKVLSELDDGESIATETKKSNAGVAEIDNSGGDDKLEPGTIIQEGIDYDSKSAHIKGEALKGHAIVQEGADNSSHMAIQKGQKAETNVVMQKGETVTSGVEVQKGQKASNGVVVQKGEVATNGVEVQEGEVNAEGVQVQKGSKQNKHLEVEKSPVPEAKYLLERNEVKELKPNLEAYLKQAMARVEIEKGTKKQSFAEAQKIVLFTVKTDKHNGLLVLCSDFIGSLNKENMMNFCIELKQVAANDHVQIQCSPPSFLDYEGLDYDSLCLRNSAIHIIQEREGAQLSVAFIEHSIAMPEVKLNEKKSKIKIDPKTLAANRGIHFDIYIFLERNNKEILYTPDQGRLSDRQLKNLIDHEANVYIDVASAAEYKRLILSQAIENLLNKNPKKEAS